MSLFFGDSLTALLHFILLRGVIVEVVYCYGDLLGLFSTYKVKLLEIQMTPVLERLSSFLLITLMCRSYSFIVWVQKKKKTNIAYGFI